MSPRRWAARICGARNGPAPRYLNRCRPVAVRPGENTLLLEVPGEEKVCGDVESYRRSCARRIVSDSRTGDTAKPPAPHLPSAQAGNGRHHPHLSCPPPQKQAAAISAVRHSSAHFGRNSAMTWNTSGPRSRNPCRLFASGGPRTDELYAFTWNPPAAEGRICRAGLVPVAGCHREHATLWQARLQGRFLVKVVPGMRPSNSEGVRI